MVADFLHNRGEPQTSFYPNFGQTEPEPEPEQRLAETLSLLWLIENVTSVIVITWQIQAANHKQWSEWPHLPLNLDESNDPVMTLHMI